MEDSSNVLIENVLKQNNQDIAFEPIPEEDESPLSQPVVGKSNTAGDVAAATKDSQQHTAAQNAAQNTSDTSSETDQNKQNVKDQNTKGQFTDAPEQEINSEAPKQEEQAQEENDDFTMPIEHAKLLADSIIGTINNTVLEVGGGFFVTIRKHKDFYDFEELIQVIDEQNAKNIKRLKLDEEDKALLRPLLIQLLRKKSATLSIEKQVLMVALSIIIKKSKIVFEMRAENDLLVEQIRDVIRREMRAAREEDEERNTNYNPPKREQSESSPEHNTSDENDMEETIYEETVHNQRSGIGLPAEVLETYH